MCLMKRQNDKRTEAIMCLLKRQNDIMNRGYNNKIRVSMCLMKRQNESKLYNNLKRQEKDKTE